MGEFGWPSGQQRVSRCQATDFWNFWIELLKTWAPVLGSLSNPATKRTSKDMVRPLGVRGHQKRSHQIASYKNGGEMFVETINESTTAIAADIDSRSRRIILHGWRTKPISKARSSILRAAMLKLPPSWQLTSSSTMSEIPALSSLEVRVAL